MFLQRIAHNRLAEWNRRVLTEADALEFCRSMRIRIVTDSRIDHGQLRYYKGYTFILISPHLDSAMRLWVLWHEIAHYLLHGYSTTRFSASTLRKKDREANYVASVAMMPRHLVEGRTIDEVAADFGYPREVVVIRYQVWEREGL